MDAAFAFDIEAGEFDLQIENWDIKLDDGLESAILVSLFTDARVELDELDDEKDDRRGFWGDAVDNAAGEVTGSKLWLLDRAKTINENLEIAKEAVEEALQWLVDDGVADSVTVTTEYVNQYTMKIGIVVARPTGPEFVRKYDYVWGNRGNAV